MKFDIDFEQTYPHSIEKVWKAITTREAIRAWLLENDFEPEAGRRFQMSYANSEGGTDRILCQVLEFEPPTRMVWSWVLEGREAEGATQVEFRLEGVDGGTRLTVRHSGDRDRETVEQFREGWTAKLGELGQTLEAA